MGGKTLRVDFPFRRQRRKQVVHAPTLAVELADVLRLGAAHVLHGQAGVVVEHAVMHLALAPCLAGGLVGLAKAVFLHLGMHRMRQRCGVQRGQQDVVGVVAGVSAGEPVELLGQRVAAGAFSAGLGQ